MTVCRFPRIALVLAITTSSLSLAALPPEIRVGLAPGAEEVRVSTDRGGLLVGTDGGALAPVAGALRFALRSAEPPASAAANSEWFVDVREEKEARQAQRVAEALETTVGAALAVERRGGSHVVVAGPFSSRESALALQQLLESAGMSEARLRELGPEPARRSRLLSIDSDWVVKAVPGESAVLRAESGRLLLDGKGYRGELRVSVSDEGRLRVVNALPLEAYLQGVVPEELGPESFSEFEALAAQAVAARTWVLTQLGRHGAQGYDVCPSAHCQVYGGASAEHELSDRAVLETRGRVLAYQGEPATAYFSSTCGGRTEAVENVFSHAPVPYLKGVSCYPERVGFTRFSGRAVAPDWQRADGSPAHELLARLWALGLLDDSSLVAGGFDKRAKDVETVSWLRAAAALVGLRLQEAAVERLETLTAIGFLTGLEDALGWAPRRAFIAPADLEAASRFFELQGLAGEELRSALLARKGGLLPPNLAPGWAEGKMSRGNVLEVLDLWLESRGVFGGPALRFLGREGEGLVVLAAGKRERRALSDAPALLSGQRDRRPALLEALDLKLNDKIWLLGPPGQPARLVQVEEDPDGAAFDRTSAYSWWERRRSFADLAREAKERAGVEGLVDLEIKRLSPAGRVIAVELTDARGKKSLIERFAARGLLGLPDARAQVEIERDPNGRPIAVRATGRGWGHGVGLCQFGAYGMALAGRTHEEILGHYFPGATLGDLEKLRLPSAPRD